MGRKKVLAQSEVGGYANKGLRCVVGLAVFAGGCLRRACNERVGDVWKIK